MGLPLLLGMIAAGFSVPDVIRTLDETGATDILGGRERGRKVAGLEMDTAMLDSMLGERDVLEEESLGRKIKGGTYRKGINDDLGSDGMGMQVGAETIVKGKEMELARMAQPVDETPSLEELAARMGYYSEV